MIQRYFSITLLLLTTPLFAQDNAATRKLVNATARNYSLTVAREVREEPKPAAEQEQSGLNELPAGSNAGRATKVSTNSGNAKVSLGQEASSAKVKESFPKEKSLNATTSMMQLQLYAIFTTLTNGIAPMMDVLEEHLDYQRKIEKNGILFGAGPFWTSDEKFCEGEEMIIVRADDTTEARKIADADPMHAKGARSYVVRPWLLNEGRLTIHLNLSSRKAELN
ncbi:MULTISPECIES: YciI family protein [Pirellulaceae]|uniref:YCII-related domain-containing protein n=2 Tax=Pirellulaceae TaxID=2691357 RepID=Q7UE98_RHOBA|nr:MULTISPECIES: YciI family protein [Pirellulaceae]TWU46610.1 YciI-like protein [Rubripirellula reticaptiva]CAD79150.1 hypothetical protein RB11485 [Rhodopirellula baltica SH 1]